MHVFEQAQLSLLISDYLCQKRGVGQVCWSILETTLKMWCLKLYFDLEVICLGGGGGRFSAVTGVSWMQLKRENTKEAPYVLAYHSTLN